MAVVQDAIDQRRGHHVELHFVGTTAPARAPPGSVQFVFVTRGRAALAMPACGYVQARSQRNDPPNPVGSS